MNGFLRGKSALCICALISILLLISCNSSEKTLQSDLETINESIDAFQALPAGTIKTISTVGQTKTVILLHFVRTEMGMDYEKRVMPGEPLFGMPPVYQGEKIEGGIFYRLNFETQEWVRAEEPEGAEQLPEFSAARFEDSFQVSHIRQVNRRDGYQEYILTLDSDYLKSQIPYVPDEDLKKMEITMEITYVIDGDGMIHRVDSERLIKLIHEDGETEELIHRVEMQYEKS